MLLDRTSSQFILTLFEVKSSIYTLDISTIEKFTFLYWFVNLTTLII